MGKQKKAPWNIMDCGGLWDLQKKAPRQTLERLNLSELQIASRTRLPRLRFIDQKRAATNYCTI